MTDSIEKPLRVEVNGRTWGLYGVEYDTADGLFTTHIYALSLEHAVAMVEELKQTARVYGRIDGVVPASFEP